MAVLIGVVMALVVMLGLLVAGLLQRNVHQWIVFHARRASRLARSGVGRDINRHHYTRGEIEEALCRPVVADLLSLIRLRNTHPAFQGAFELLPSDADSLHMRWHNAGAESRLHVNLATGEHVLTASPAGELPGFRILNIRQG